MRCEDLSRHNAVGVAMVLAVAGCVGQAPPAIERGLLFLADGSPEEAATYFDSLRVAHPSNVDVSAWWAHVRFVQREFDRAVYEARRVLTVEPCHAVAHRVIGASLNPQYAWDRANDEQSWFHLSESRRCDPSDAFTWVESIVPSMRHNEPVVEDAVLSSLVESGVLPQAAVAFGRWMLNETPDRAVLVTWGDLDTFPAWGLQRAQRVRSDVAVVNLNLLEAWWYATQASERHGLPLPGDRASYTVASTLAHWRAISEDGTLGRPLIFAPTVPGEMIPGGVESTELASAYRMSASPRQEAAVDLARASVASFASLNGAEFRSPGEGRAGPFQRTAGDAFAPLVLNLALRQAEILAVAGRASETGQLAAWATTFADEAGLVEEQRTSVARLQQLAEGLR